MMDHPAPPTDSAIAESGILKKNQDPQKVSENEMSPHQLRWPHCQGQFGQHVKEKTGKLHAVVGLAASLLACRPVTTTNTAWRIQSVWKNLFTVHLIYSFICSISIPPFVASIWLTTLENTQSNAGNEFLRTITRILCKSHLLIMQYLVDVQFIKYFLILTLWWLQVNSFSRLI